MDFKHNLKTHSTRTFLATTHGKVVVCLALGLAITMPFSIRIESRENPIVFAAEPNAAQESRVPHGYHLTFEDTFTSMDLSDTKDPSAKWFTHTVQCCLSDTSSPKTPTYMASVNDSDGHNPFSILAGGGLDIRLQKVGGAWYSGVIATVDQDGNGFSQKYGYFEMKAKFPNAVGTWPAFWLLNSAALNQHAPAGEIDVVESYMFAPRYINVTLHDWTPPGSTPAHHLAKVADLSNGFHTFGMLWTATTMSFYCDGAFLFSTPTPAIMHQPFYPIVDLGLGGGWPTKNTPNSADMQIAYVRVYAP